MKPIDRLRQEYQRARKLKQGDFYLNGYNGAIVSYQTMRLFCLDCNLVSFNDIEVMERSVEVENSVSV